MEAVKHHLGSRRAPLALVGLVSLVACATAPPREVRCKERTDDDDWVVLPGRPRDESRVWGESAGGCRLSIWPAHQGWIAGEPILVTITLRNDGPTPIRFPRADTPEQTFTFTVTGGSGRDESGDKWRPAPFTLRGKKLLAAVDPAAQRPVLLKPGEELTFPVHLNRFVDLTFSQAYLVQVKKVVFVGRKPVEVVSNEASIYVGDFPPRRPQDVEFRDLRPPPGPGWSARWCQPPPPPLPPNDPRPWGTTVGGCRLSLAPRSRETITGDAVDLVATFRNDGPDNIRFFRIGSFEQEFTYFTVLRDGEPVPVTVRGKCILIETDPTAARPMPIPPGDEFVVPIHLSAYFDMSLPGEYTVELGRDVSPYPPAPHRDLYVISNRVTLRVRDEAPLP